MEVFKKNILIYMGLLCSMFVLRICSHFAAGHTWQVFNIEGLRSNKMPINHSFYIAFNREQALSYKTKLSNS